jgi:hypothetical protein
MRAYPGRKVYEYDAVALAGYLSGCSTERRIRRLLDGEHRLTQWLLAMGGFDDVLPTEEILYGHALLAHLRRERQLLYGPTAIWSGPFLLDAEAV